MITPIWCVQVKICTTLSSSISSPLLTNWLEPPVFDDVWKQKQKQIALWPKGVVHNQDIHFLRYMYMCNTNSYGKQGSRLLFEQRIERSFSEAPVIAGYVAVKYIIHMGWILIVHMYLHVRSCAYTVIIFSCRQVQVIKLVKSMITINNNYYATRNWSCN